MKVTRAALAALLTLAAAGAHAQQQPAPGRALDLGSGEYAALTALRDAAAGSDRAAQDSALAAARSAVSGSSGRYALAHYQLEIGRARGDAQLQDQAVDAMVESGLAEGDELAGLLSRQASRAFSAGDNQRVERLLARIVELQPDNAAAIADQAQFKARMGERAPAVALFQRAIAAHQARGQAAPESWHHRALALAYDGRLAPQAIALARALVTAYPSPGNWRDALLVYRDLAQPDPAFDLDIGRLMRATQALNGERDYLQLAETLAAANLHAEAKAVLDEGVSRGMLESNKPVVAQMLTAARRGIAAERTALARLRTQAMAATAAGSAARTAADAHLSFGQYAEAAELYRMALQKGGEDPNLVNSRLGAALALAGRRAEAEAALRAVTGPRADLAGLWLAWLARRPA